MGGLTGVVSWWNTLRVSNLCGLQVSRDLFELRNALPNSTDNESCLLGEMKRVIVVQVVVRVWSKATIMR